MMGNFSKRNQGKYAIEII